MGAVPAQQAIVGRQGRGRFFRHCCIISRPRHASPQPGPCKSAIKLTLTVFLYRPALEKHHSAAGYREVRRAGVAICSSVTNPSRGCPATRPPSRCRKRSRCGVPILDRKSVVEGKSVSVRVDLGGRRIIKKKKK